MPTFVEAYIRAVTALNRLAFKVAALMIYAIVPIMLIDVVMRYAFHAPTNWGMELAVLIFGPYFLIAGPYVLHLKGHVAMDILRQRLPDGTDRWFELINLPVVMVFAAILIDFSLPLAIESWNYGETSFSAWNPQIWWNKAAVPLALALLFLQALAEFLRVLFRDPTLKAHPHG